MLAIWGKKEGEIRIGRRTVKTHGTECVDLNGLAHRYCTRLLDGPWESSAWSLAVHTRHGEGRCRPWLRGGNKDAIREALRCVPRTGYEISCQTFQTESFLSTRPATIPSPRWLSLKHLLEMEKNIREIFARSSSIEIYKSWIATRYVSYCFPPRQLKTTMDEKRYIYIYTYLLYPQRSNEKSGLLILTTTARFSLVPLSLRKKDDTALEIKNCI